jgi:hypothetical protein
MSDKTYLLFKRVLMRVLKEYDIMYTNKECHSKVIKRTTTKNIHEIFAFLDRNFRDWAHYQGGYVRYYKAQLELAYILWKVCDDNNVLKDSTLDNNALKDSILDYIRDFLRYIVTYEDVYEYGEEDDEDSMYIRESGWYLMVEEKTF